MATLSDVARAAGLSPTAVSRHLNGRITLPAETRARIEAAIDALDYRPNLLARRLSTGRTEAIGLVTPEIDNPFFAELAAAVEVAAADHGYAVSITSTRGDPARETAAIERLRDRHVDGLMLMTGTPQDGTLAAALEGLTNVLLLDEDIPGPDLPRLFVDNTAGARAATRQLIELGHRHIAHISGQRGVSSVEQRYAGYLEALAEAGLSAGPCAFGRYRREFGEVAAREMLAADPRPTAIVTGSDEIAIGVMTVARQNGLTLPADLSLTGFDDILYAALIDPPLTTVRQPVAEMGRIAFDTLLASLNGEEVPRLTILPVTLQIRNSTASPKGLVR
ncbi:LacI family DNA-binding transcriptional regulator [Flavimaricola marinus]|uniref:HTH-type transcriptional regulator GalS n=1 Tax=Flavimaricola marinus TaxID=1819565 RepID=A0A238LBX6_9RHOB|nr:LacI family DNA-binding transcriptional regulator [Flavimaricola marinus]SMY07138.1 HTH-type transcriptional regulator GalS [Flavimaricola marinus]